MPLAYCGIALVAWLNFVLLPPDGLANLSLIVVVFPATLPHFALRPNSAPAEFVLIPEGLEYYAGHTVDFAAAVMVIAASLWRFGRFLDRARGYYAPSAFHPILRDRFRPIADFSLCWLNSPHFESARGYSGLLGSRSINSMRLPKGSSA